MLSRVEAGKKGRGDSNSRALLNEIDTINKALYLDKNSSKSLVSSAIGRSKAMAKPQLPNPKSKQRAGLSGEDSLQKDKKSIWNWRPLKAFSRSRRFECSFYLQVHSIEGFPSSLNGASVRVHWKRRDGELVTSPAKVFQGVVKLEEKLVHDCQVYGSRNGPHHSAKYEAKHFLLYAMVLASPELDLGKHRIDLTRLLPLTLEELEGEKSSGNWATSYKLSGKAAGAVMNVSFGYSVIGDNSKTDFSVPQLQNNLKQGEGKSKMRRSESLNRHARVSSQSMENIKDLHEVLPTSNSELASSVITLYQKFDEDKIDGAVDNKPDTFGDHTAPTEPNTYPSVDSSIGNADNERNDREFSVTEQGIELSRKTEEKSGDDTAKNADVSVVESVDVPPTSIESDSSTQEAVDDQHVVQDDDDDSKGNDTCTKDSLMKELETALTNLEMDSLDYIDDEENNLDVQSNNLLNNNGKSLSFNDVTESEFLEMLGLENSPIGFSSESESESPRERLLREFEKDTLASGSSLFGFETEDVDLGECVHEDLSESGWETLAESFGLPADEEQQSVATEEGNHKRRSKTLEDLETEALMREWGLNEEAFQYSPPKGSGGFGSPINLMPEEPAELPPLGEGLGPFLQTKSGGFVRSMTPSLFKNARSGGSLVMQVSSPVVVPAEMGSGVMEILQGLASVGIEKLSMQASKLMPLEDITGKTMQQVAWEAVPALEENERHPSELEHKTGQSAFHGQKERSSGSRTSKSRSSSASSEMGPEYVSLEDLAPLAMDKMEALSIEGLRIQSGMSDDEAPSNISSKSIGEISALQGKGSNTNGSLGLEGAAGLQLLDIKDGGEDVGGLMGLSLTLDEWMRLDSGEIGDEEEISERTTKILAAHHANSLNTIRGQSKGEKRRGKRKCGLLGNNFTVALMVQLRDPLRNYEPVGAPMLSLIQVERVFVPPKPKIYRTVSVAKSCGEDEESEAVVKKEMEETEEALPEEVAIPKFKITEVHVAGLKSEPGKKKLWGSSKQQQSGSRWLVANGMGKNSKNPFMKSKAVSKATTPAGSTTKVQPGESLWSISSRIHGTGDKWKELAALNPHIRNPNVIFPNETIRLC